MKNDETWTYAMREISRRGSRTASNVFGYTISVAVLLILVSWLSYAKESFIEQLRDVGAHFIAFKPSSELCCPTGVIDDSEGFIAAGSTNILFETALIDKMNSFPSVLEASPYLSFQMKDKLYGHTYIIGGFDPTKRISFGATLCAPADIVSGRFLTDNDRGVVMLEKVYAEVRGLDIGSNVIVGNHFYEVIGIVNPAVRPARADMYMHIADASRTIGDYITVPVNHRHTANVALIESTDATTFTRALRDVESLGFETFGFACSIPAAGAMGMNERSTMLLMVFIALGTLVFSGKTQHASVVERQHDIGILKAIGWSNKRIVKQVILESVIQSFIGGVIGVIIAILVIYFAPLKSLSGVDAGMTLTVSWGIIPIAIILSIVGGVISGLLPARSSAKKNPADAIRHL